MFHNFFFIVTSVVELNTFNLDPDPDTGYWLNLEFGSGSGSRVMLSVLNFFLKYSSFGGKNSNLGNYSKKLSPEEIFSQLGL